MAPRKSKEEIKEQSDVSTSATESVTVNYRNGTREYSREVHGDNFQDLAKQFAEKFKGTIA